jgi:hypothetical protein
MLQSPVNATVVLFLNEILVGMFHNYVNREMPTKSALGLILSKHPANSAIFVPRRSLLIETSFEHPTGPPTPPCDRRARAAAVDLAFDFGVTSNSPTGFTPTIHQKGPFLHQSAPPHPAIRSL